MNAIEQLERKIIRDVAGARTKIDRPRTPHGEWWLDAFVGDHRVVIQWSQRRGFGVSSSVLGDSFGERPEETFSTQEAATERVLDLLKRRGHTVPPRAVLLKELRSLLGFTQASLAQQLGVQQAAISRLERREDITLSSLRRYVEALGAELEINVRTAQGDVLRLADESELS